MIRRSLIRIPAPPGAGLSYMLKYQTHDVQLAPCVAAAAISKGPAMSW